MTMYRGVCVRKSSTNIGDNAMADVRVTRSKHDCCFTAVTPLGLKFLQKELGQEPAIRDVEYMEDIIEHMKKEGLEVDY
jgi:hypothetical protein